MVQTRVVFVFINQFVLRLGHSDFMVIYHVKVTGCRKLCSLFWRRVTRVKEPVFIPAGATKFAPFEYLFNVFVFFNVANVNRAPVASRLAQAVGHQGVIVISPEQRNTHSAVFAHRIRIHEHFFLFISFAVINNRLVLKSVVLGYKNIVAHLIRCPNTWVIDEFRHSICQLLAVSNLLEVSLSHLILSVYPGFRFGARIVFEPVIGVGYFDSKILVNHFSFLRFRILQCHSCFFFLRTRSRC